MIEQTTKTSGAFSTKLVLTSFVIFFERFFLGWETLTNNEI
jgi:hypothetical protein